MAQHLGGVHRWATEVVRTGERAPQAVGAVKDAALAGWFAEGADALLEVLRADGPERPCWTMAGPGGTVAFWQRRQALETAVHRVDAQHALGAHEPVPADLALDGVAEVVEVLHPRQVHLQRVPAPVLGVELRSGGRRWRVGPAPATAVLEGPPSDLLLVLWRRLPRSTPGLTATGDTAGLDALITAGPAP